MGLWQESGAMQRHKFLGEAAEVPEISQTSVTGHSCVIKRPQPSRIKSINQSTLIENYTSFRMSEGWLTLDEGEDGTVSEGVGTLDSMRSQNYKGHCNAPVVRVFGAN